MIEFAWWWLLAALPLPWLLRRALPPATGGDPALRVPDLAPWATLATAGRRRHRLSARAALLAAAWVGLVVAAARPQWVGEATALPFTGRDLMLAVDLSGSMEQTDFVIDGEVVDRLTATKAVASRFIDRRRGDRVGLVLFGSRAYLQCPLTFDRATVKTLLDEAEIGLAGKQTAIGDAIGLALKRLEQTRAERHVLVLLTDGANTAGAVDPLKAAELAAARGLTIYTIGVGADRATARRLFGIHRYNPALDLDEQTLRAIAARTGGRYFRARSTRELERIYAALDEIEPAASDALMLRPRKALFVWPLGVALAAGAALLALPLRRELRA